jgi:hypothetical protein
LVSTSENLYTGYLLQSNLLECSEGVGYFKTILMSLGVKHYIPVHRKLRVDLGENCRKFPVQALVIRGTPKTLTIVICY